MPCRSERYQSSQLDRADLGINLTGKPTYLAANQLARAVVVWNRDLKAKHPSKDGTKKETISAYPALDSETSE